MNNSASNRRTLGDELLDLGWRQGTLFSAPSVYCYWNRNTDSGTEEHASLDKRAVKTNEKLIIASQDCDIKMAEDIEPYVEALLCKVENQKFVNKINLKSARWFLVDANTRLVVHSMYRILLTKSLLKSFEPISWPGTIERLDQYIRWLARHYDRPAFPDKMVETFQYPIERAIKETFEKDEEVEAAFNRSVHEIRVSLPLNENPPFELHLLFIVIKDGLTQEEADAIDIVKETILSSVNPMFVHLDADIRIATEEEISMKEYYAMRPIFLENFTYKGEEIQGILPYGRL